MLIAGLGVVAALAFVLGLGALCLWGLKRMGKVSLGARTRVPVEVVQRMPLGPKAGLAIVRVGEKVMAVSVSEGGVRPLFELDEADRQRVLASSQVPTPVVSSAEAAAAFPAQAVPSLPGPFGAMLQKTLGVGARTAQVAHVATSSEMSASIPAPQTLMDAAPSALAFSPTEAREIPGFLTAPLTLRSGAPVAYGPTTVRRAAPRPTTVRAAAQRPALSTPVPASSAGVQAVFGGALRGAMHLAGGLALFVAVTLTAPVSQAHAQAQAQAQPQTQASAPTPAAAQPQIPVAATRPAATAQAPALPAGAAVSGALPPMPAPLPPTVQKSIPAVQGRVQTTAQPGTRPQSPADSAAAILRQEGVIPKGVSAQGLAQPAPISAEDAVMRLMPQMDVKMGDEKSGGLRLNGTVGVVVMMGLLTLLPTLLLMMTGFTRILIVLHFLKQAMGTQSAPPAQLLGALALLLTGFVMAPTLREVNERALTPWMDGKISQVEMMKTSVVPMRTFMLKQTREADLKAFVDMSRLPKPKTAADIPLHVLMSAFVASELRTSFQIGFAIYLPFIIIDTVVASVLMSMGMFMLPPAMISLPFKLLLFVLVDGWSLTISSLVHSFK